MPAGHSKGFTGRYNDTLKGRAFTSGAWGEIIRWDSLTTSFPINGIQAVDLHIPSNYFFLQVQNDSTSSLIREIRPNYTLLTERDIILAPPLAYPTLMNVGYFYASSSSNVYIVSKSTLKTWFFSPVMANMNLPMTQDQYFQAICN